jgi:predicted HicB family RNase H-like nuclease
MRETQQAIQQHGAKAVYQAATSHMAGDKANGLAKVGLTAKTLGEVFAIQSEAYKQMGPADQAIDHAQATAALDGIAKRGRKPLPAEARKDARVELRVHPDTKAAWQAKADAAGASLAAWIEATLDRAKK